MKHIHDHKVIHRDLKGGNIFLTKNGILKIGDFGISKVLKAKPSPYNQSPEGIQSNIYTNSTDIWSMGVILYEMCM